MATPSKMAKRHTSPYTLDIPALDLITYVFSSGSVQSRSSPQYFDADRPEVSYSLNQAESLVRRVGKGLQNLGLKTNDKVLLYSGNSVYFPVLFWGTVASGCVFTGCSPGASVTELSYQLQDSEARLLITGVEGISNALKAAEQVGIPKERVIVFSDPHLPIPKTGYRHWTQIWASEQEVSSWKWRTFSSVKEAQSVSAVINYSSGTTGVPKGVELSHYNIVANSLQVAFKRDMVGKSTRARERRERIDKSGERWLAPLPMFHAYGQNWYCATAARMGVKVFIMPKYNIDRYMLYLDIYRITFLTGVPTLLVQLAKHPGAATYNLKAIESVVTGSAPLNPAIGTVVRDTYLRDGVLVKQGWGLTESTCSATGFAQDDEDDGRSIGWLNPNMSAKIVDSADQRFTQPGDIPYPIGEIWITGPNIMIGYYKKPRETADTVVYEGGERWLRTGDIGYIDSRGCIYIVDRLKELIKVKGLQVAPAEIEQTLLANSAIADAAVIGKIKREGEYPKAFVVKAVDAHITAREVQQYIESRMSKHKWLTGGVEFIDAIPRNASGKVMRRILKQMDETEVAKL